jgi:lipopolysaccharide/colanic/teichoic acid biosynthesis glycosyltransferase
LKNKNPNIYHSAQIIALINCDKAVSTLLTICNFQDRQLINFKNVNDLAAAHEKQTLNIVAVISQSEIAGPFGIELLEIFEKLDFPKLPFFLVSNEPQGNITKLALRAGVVDVFALPMKIDKVQTRLNFTINNWINLTKDRRVVTHAPYRIPNETRVFDLLFSTFLLIILSPIMLLISILIKLESKGSVFTHSLRVGSNYHIFKMFNFRTMHLNGDNRLNADSAENNDVSYNSLEGGLCEECRETRVKCKFPIYADKVTWCEKKFINGEKVNSDNITKGRVSNPELTKIGWFLRKTKLNQLPELWNVHKGDMSIVGNLPLPLSEAEKLTTDKYVLRFMAPSGITGLWQIEKRKKNYTNQPGRLVLDIRYARTQNFQNDMLLLAKTIPALLK